MSGVLLSLICVGSAHELADADTAHESHRTPLAESFSLQGPGPWELTELWLQGGAPLSTQLERAVAATSGRYVAFLPPVDRLEPGALAGVAAALNELGALGALKSSPSRAPSPDLRSLDAALLPPLIYTDEQWPCEDARSGVFTKPHFSLRALRQFDLLGRTTWVRRDLLAAVGPLASDDADLDAAWEWDLHLRLAEAALEGADAATNSTATDPAHRSPILHVPILGSWRPEPPARDETANAAGLRAVRAHLKRRGVNATAELTEHGYVRIDPPLPAGEDGRAPMVSVVIPTAGGRRELRGENPVLVENAVRSLVDRTDYENFEIILVTSAGTDPSVVERCAQIAANAGGAAPVRWVPVEGAFNFSHSCNAGVAVAHGEYILLLNDDTEVISPGWLARMVALAADDSAGPVGAVGAKLLFADGTIQHVGVHSDQWGNVGHTAFGEPDEPGPFGQNVVDVDAVGVTGACLLTRPDLYEQMGGLSESLPVNYNDVDFCFKLAAHGYHCVVAMDAVLYHLESSTRKVEFTTGERTVLQWWLPWSRNDRNVELLGVS